VLFSDDLVAGFINRSFEPAWQSVRPVPLVHIDFGNGKVLTRTLNGNIATHVCTADGLVLDTVPGIYTPRAYLEKLGQFRLLANYVDQTGQENRAQGLRDYHERLVKALKSDAVPPRLVNVAPIAKARIERGVKAVLVSGSDATKAPPQPNDVDGWQRRGGVPDSELSRWSALAEDTRINESGRRVQIHERLAELGPVPPERLTRWLYKNVLHADLDDPYLGLGDVLFANYPFRDQVH
jgi:hypothetical protein